ncbi:MAG TPA: hypothetical protein PKK80_03105 [Bacilli bacterium]|nr:hypothetical protein [Bacilli bacterium]
MYIYDTTNPYLSLYHDTLFKLGISRSNTTNYPLADFIRSANNWYRRVNSWIWNATGEWEYDDSNYTNLPVATADLETTSGSEQQDYELPSTAQKIDRIEIKDSNGDWYKLKPINKEEVKSAMSEFYETAGKPVYYDLVGRSIILYPKPSADEVTSTAGIKCYFSRDVDEFTTSDTTQAPGFVENFHEIISIGAAIDYSNTYDQTRLNVLLSNLEKLKEELEQFYGSRHRELRPKIRRKYNNNKRI